MRGLRGLWLTSKQWCCNRGSPQKGAHTQNELNTSFLFLTSEWHMETACASGRQRVNWHTALAVLLNSARLTTLTGAVCLRAMQTRSC